MNLNDLAGIARTLVADNKGILAADESTGTIEKRFKSIDVVSTEEHRRAYRDLLFTTPGAEKFISGVILFDETLRQKTTDSVPFAKHLSALGVVPGIKVDKGAKAMAGHLDEKVTEGLDGLRERLKEYYELGARFTKWRAVITIGSQIPTPACIDANAHALARYAALAQEANMVPIVEPEVLMDGDHTIERCEEVTAATLQAVFAELYRQGVALEGMLLKPNMVISGMNCPRQASVNEVAGATVACLRRYVPAAVPGIVFLSGGQSAEDATAHLSSMNKQGPHPWKLSFSYGRALQAPALTAWKGNSANITAAQEAFYHRAQCNAAACAGNYNLEMEKAQAVM